MKRWLVALGLLAGTAQAEALKNWFGDPFFQASADLRRCPLPLGPLLTEQEQRREAHWRAERGTSCWLAGRCAHSNAYAYDAGLAAPVRAALAQAGLQGSSVWVTIQRRWVFLEGCVSSLQQAQALEAAARSVPRVETVVPALSVGTRTPPRYAVHPGAGTSPAR